MNEVYICRRQLAAQFYLASAHTEVKQAIGMTITIANYLRLLIYCIKHYLIASSTDSSIPVSESMQFYKIILQQIICGDVN